MGITQKQLVELATNLDSLLQCLASVDEDNAEAMQRMPGALRLAAEHSTKLYEALQELDGWEY